MTENKKKKSKTTKIDQTNGDNQKKSTVKKPLTGYMLFYNFRRPLLKKIWRKD